VASRSVGGGYKSPVHRVVRHNRRLRARRVAGLPQNALTAETIVLLLMPRYTVLLISVLIDVATVHTRLLCAFIMNE